MKMMFLASVAVLALPILPAAGQTTTSPVTQTGGDLKNFVSSVEMPYKRFVLPNGLRVIVHTDRSAPMVSVNVYYDVGSKHEPEGRTGFAHLFEHLMFNGSENVPSDFMGILEKSGAATMNGMTQSDLTTYFEEVPVGLLDRALFMESDRMGYLLGALTESKLEQQRGVVQNEKRQGDNSPYGLVNYKLIEAMYPKDHPYGHSVIGSMADLDAARLDDVKGWFRKHYGPNNAVLVLSGDIDETTARRLVTRYFGAIPAGPRTPAVVAPVPVLTRDKTEMMTDRVAAPMVVRAWAVPGQLDPENVPLEVVAATLGGLETSPLKEKLVRQEKLFSQVSVGLNGAMQGSLFEIQGIVAQGVDPAKAGRRLDDLVAQYLREGPGEDEVNRHVAKSVAQQIGALESIVYKANQLGMGELLADDPNRNTKDLVATAALTPAVVRATAEKWLSRPVYRLTVLPGARDDKDLAAVPPEAAVATAPAPATAFKGTRGPLPPVTDPVAEVRFPKVEHARLANGMEVLYAKVATVPMTQIALDFDAGIAADVAGRLGTERLTVEMLTEGAGNRDATAVAREKERLGAYLNLKMTEDRTGMTLVVPSINVVPALNLLADVARRPRFAETDVIRKRTELLADIRQELTDPGSISERITPRLIDAASPYAKASGAGDPVAVAKLTRADLVAFYQTWLRPDKAKIFIVSDRPLAEFRSILERAFGDWRATGPAGVKDFTAAPKASSPRIVLIDQPDAPQSIVMGVVNTPLRAKNLMEDVRVANDALGGSFQSRLNIDLRETRHWTYGAGSTFMNRIEAAPFIVQSSVQADKTGATLVVMRDQVTSFVTTAPLTSTEFDNAIQAKSRSVLSEYRGASSILNGMQVNDMYGRADDYYTTLPKIFGSLTMTGVRQAFRDAVVPSRITWLVIGDAKKVRPQLDGLGLPVERMTALGSAR